MSARVEVEEIRTTASEKLLAAVLAVFVLVGGVWTYVKVDDYVRERISVEFAGSAEQRAALARASAAREGLAAAGSAERSALQDLLLDREAYRTALDAGRAAPGLARAYRASQAAHRRARADVAAAAAAVAAAQPAADAASASIAREAERREERQELVSFLLRGAVTVALLGLGFWLLTRLRRGGSRYFPLAWSVVAAATVLAFALATDYITDYVDPLDLGPLVLAFVGGVMTLAAFAILQRYLALRLPARRTRNRECPFCGYPVRGNRHCERCGRAVVASCTACGGDRRVGTLRCGACGAA